MTKEKIQELEKSKSEIEEIINKNRCYSSGDLFNNFAEAMIIIKELQEENENLESDIEATKACLNGQLDKNIKLQEEAKSSNAWHEKQHKKDHERKTLLKHQVDTLQEELRQKEDKTKLYYGDTDPDTGAFGSY
jgi:hypothetical protein